MKAALMKATQRTKGLRRLSSLVLRKPSRLLAEMNSNALLVDWSRHHPAERVFAERSAMFRYLNDEVLRHEPISYLEFGVHKGKSILEWATLNTCGDSEFIGFDTFEGLPEEWDRVRGASPKGRFDVGGTTPHTDDPRIRFVKGLFQQTVPGFLEGFTPKHRLVIHNDSDLYSSSLYVLTMLHSLLAPGSIAIFDEFFSSSHEFQAFFDYARSYYREVRLLASVDRNPYVKAALEFI
jgi:O-methyltransferase